ncbi:MAG: DEAD/DEAH box helicase, partial [Firmicutes bacterium]|nr:DEAD/DEAH box helicase [Bacillota bacterium]
MGIRVFGKSSDSSLPDDLGGCGDPHDIQEVYNRIDHALGPHGVIAGHLDEYEYRPGQIEMARVVAKSFWEGRVGIIEAGTGTGKSLAYLIPAIFWAVSRGEKVVISTNTITLQEQLINKDIPFLHGVLDVAFRAALIKGWSNYLCLNRLYTVNNRHQATLWETGIHELGFLLDWVARSSGGSRSELDFAVSDELWQEVCAESDACLRSDCSYFERCFYFRERRQASAADIIVVNHHLLFADLSLRQVLGFDSKWSVLPPYRHVIWDEAHHVEMVATDYFGCSISRLGVNRLLGRLFRTKQGGERGLLPHVRFLLESEDASARKSDRVSPETLCRRLDEDIIPTLHRAEAAGQRFFGRLATIVQGKATSGERVLALAPAPDGPMLSHVMAEELKMFLDTWRELVDAAAIFKEDLEYLKGEIWDTTRAELGAVNNRLNEIQANTIFLTSQADVDHVYWAELSHRQGEPSLAAAPIEVAEHLRHGVYQHLHGAVFTSATLAIDSRFDHLCKRLGLDLPGDMSEEHCLTEVALERIVSSPFFYREQVLLCIPTDMEAPQKGRYGTGLAQYILDVVLASLGRAFVLFTSYRQLREVYAFCRGPLRDAGINALCQGTAPRGLLLDEFRKDTHSVLFGTSSFWEGVDVPGEPLSCVILAKLPFQVPTEPVVAARIRRLEELGENPFASYMLPQAVIRFKQGFGRLIRRSTDQGVVVVCDNRTLTKAYGRTFLQSIPQCQMMAAPANETLAAISHWLRS